MGEPVGRPTRCAARRVSSSALRGWLRARSVSARSAVSGVRSSWLARSRNSRSWRKERSRRCSMSFRVSARRRSSSRAGGTLSRWSRPEAVMAAACRRSRSIGCSASPATSQPAKQARAIAAGPPSSRTRRNVCRASVRSVIVVPTTSTSDARAEVTGRASRRAVPATLRTRRCRKVGREMRVNSAGVSRDVVNPSLVARIVPRRSSSCAKASPGSCSRACRGTSASPTCTVASVASARKRRPASISSRSAAAIDRSIRMLIATSRTVIAAAKAAVVRALMGSRARVIASRFTGPRSRVLGPLVVAVVADPVPGGTNRL